MSDTQTYQAQAFTAKGTSRDPVALPAALFDGTVHVPAMHQAVKAYLANQRQGTAATKIRKYVVGGNQKPWKQKGTGRARAGSTRAPHWVGGGTVFGPIPRSYAQYVPRQVRALARKSALNARARENAIVLIDGFDFDAPKTKLMRALVDRVGGGDKKVLVLTNGAKENVFRSGRNLPNVHVMPYADVSTYHLLWSEMVLIEEAALSVVDGTSRPQTADGRPQTAAKKSSVKVAAKAVKKTAKAEKKTAEAKKKTARAAKPAAKSAKKKGK
jgi:large subunit ribosomal protein L4